MKSIALDYDHTFSAAPGFWTEFVSLAQDQGIDIRFVTSRGDYGSPVNDDIIEDSVMLEIPIIYTAGEQKEAFCFSVGFIVDVWIDDDPMGIIDLQHAKEIAG